MVLAAVASPVVAAADEYRLGIETPPMTREELAGRAEYILHGTVESISVIRDLSNRFDEWSYSAVYRIDRVEQGFDLAPEDRVTVEYWWRRPLGDESRDAVDGFGPLPYVGTTGWLFARRAPENPEVLVPILPNGWEPDEPTAADPELLYGGTLIQTRDVRTTSLAPLGWAVIVMAVGIAVASMRVGPQNRPAVLLLAIGVAVAGAALVIW